MVYVTEREENKKEVQLSFRLNEELKRKFNAKVKGLGLDAKDILTNFVSSYVAGIRGAETTQNEPGKNRIEPVAGPAAKYLPEHRKLFEMLEAVLESGNQRAIRLVTQNLEIFQEFVQVRGHGSEHQQTHRVVKTKKKRVGGR